MTQLPEAALRAFLVRDAAETTRLTRQLGGEAMRDYQYLAYAALAVIAGWRFRTGYSDADVVRCVAAIRLARTADGGESGLQPAMAEDVLRMRSGKMSRLRRTTWNGSAPRSLSWTLSPTAHCPVRKTRTTSSRKRERWPAGGPRTTSP